LILLNLRETHVAYMGFFILKFPAGFSKPEPIGLGAGGDMEAFGIIARWLSDRDPLKVQGFGVDSALRNLRTCGLSGDIVP